MHQYSLQELGYWEVPICKCTLNIRLLINLIICSIILWNGISIIILIFLHIDCAFLFLYITISTSQSNFFTLKNKNIFSMSSEYKIELYVIFHIYIVFFIIGLIFLSVIYKILSSMLTTDLFCASYIDQYLLFLLDLQL